MKHRNAGFTLVELLLVVTILATTAALVAPSFRGFYAGRQVADAAARLSVLLRRARTKAATEQLRVRLNTSSSVMSFVVIARSRPSV